MMKHVLHILKKCVFDNQKNSVTLIMELNTSWFNSSSLKDILYWLIDEKKKVLLPSDTYLVQWISDNKQF